MKALLLKGIIALLAVTLVASATNTPSCTTDSECAVYGGNGDPE